MSVCIVYAYLCMSITLIQFVLLFMKMHLNLLLLIQRQCGWLEFGILNVKMAPHLISNLILMLSAFNFNVHKSKGVSIQSNRPE